MYKEEYLEDIDNIDDIINNVKIFIGGDMLDKLMDSRIKLLEVSMSYLPEAVNSYYDEFTNVYYYAGHNPPKYKSKQW